MSAYSQKRTFVASLNRIFLCVFHADHFGVGHGPRMAPLLRPEHRHACTTAPEKPYTLQILGECLAQIMIPVEEG